MADTNEEKKQINVQMDTDLAAMLDEMVEQEGDTDRSKFIRKLIRQEFARRAGIGLVGSDELPGPDGAKKIPVYLMQGKKA